MKRSISRSADWRLFLVLVVAALCGPPLVQAFIPAAVEHAIKSWFNSAGKLVGFTATGALTAGSFVSPDLGTTGANRIRIIANDSDIPTTATCANQGLANTITILDVDESASDSWIVCVGTADLLPLAVPNCPLAGATHLTFDTSNHTWGCD